MDKVDKIENDDIDVYATSSITLATNSIYFSIWTDFQYPLT